MILAFIFKYLASTIVSSTCSAPRKKNIELNEWWNKFLETMTLYFFNIQSFYTYVLAFLCDKKILKKEIIRLWTLN